MKNTFAYALIGFIALSACASKKKTETSKKSIDEKTEVPVTKNVQNTAGACDNPWGTDENTNRQKFGYMQANYQSKNYKECHANWSVLIANAPCAHINIYKIGEVALKKLIDAEVDADLKQKYISDLSILFKNRIKYFPQDSWKQKERWAKTIYKYAPNEYEIIDNNLEAIINKDQDSTESNVMIYYLNNTFNAFNAEKVSKDKMFETYSKLSDIVETNIENNANDSAELAKWLGLEGSLNQIIDKVGTCEDLITQYKPELPNRTADADWLNKAEKALRAKRCTKDPLYISILEKLYAQDPSESICVRLANYYYSQNNSTKGNQWMQKAINQNPGSTINSDRYVKMANKALKAGSNGTARNYADKALVLNSRNGYAILIKGNALYKMARAKCSGFDKKAAAWIMMDYALKAKNADGRVAGQANRTYNRYAAYKPGQEDTFMLGLKKGQSYTIKCVGVNVTVR